MLETLEAPPQTVEVLKPNSLQLAHIVSNSKLDKAVEQSIIQAFLPTFVEVGEAVEQAQSINVTDESQTAQMEAARTCRLRLKKARTATDKIHKELKENPLRYGQAIDGVRKAASDFIKHEEERLQAMEDFVENQRRERMAMLQSEREDALLPFCDVADYTGLNLAEMPDAQWQMFFAGAQARFNERAAVERLAQEQRMQEEAKAREDAENQRKENERIAAENEKLRLAAEAIELERRAEREAAAEERQRVEAETRRVAAEAEAALQAEREKAERERLQAESAARFAREAIEQQARREREELQAKINETARIEREAREKAEAELQAQREAELQRMRTEIDAQHRAAAAPDREKLINFAATLREIRLPEMSTEGGILAGQRLLRNIDKLAAIVEADAETLTQ